MLQRRSLCAEAAVTPRWPEFVDEKRTQCDGIIRPADITVE
jgi:hypothetical protein